MFGNMSQSHGKFFGSQLAIKALPPHFPWGNGRLAESIWSVIIDQAMPSKETAYLSHPVAATADDTAEKAAGASDLIGGCAFCLCFGGIKAPASKGFYVSCCV